MADEKIKDTADEIVNESVEPVQEGTETIETPEETTEETQQETTSKTESGESRNRDDEYLQHVQNWRALREKADRAERERLEAIKERDELKKRYQEQDKPQESYDLGDDDLAEGKHLKHYKNQTEQKIAMLEMQLIESKIKEAYPDFDEVVNNDTVGMLRDADPELAESLAYNPNLYSKAIATYKAIKRSGVSKPNYDREKEVVQKNTNKPRTVTSLSPQQGDSPLTRANAFANGLTDDLKKQLWQEMKDIVDNS